MNIYDRFFSKTEVGPISLLGTNCIQWIAGHVPFGYGSFWYKDRMYAAHRVVYFLFHGENSIPHDKELNHLCNNPSCVNLEHLEVVSSQGNSDYVVKQGRQAKGTKHSNARLTKVQVQNIRSLYAGGLYSQALLGKMFKITQTAVGRIINKKIWT